MGIIRHQATIVREVRSVKCFQVAICCRHFVQSAPRVDLSQVESVQTFRSTNFKTLKKLDADRWQRWRALPRWRFVSLTFRYSSRSDAAKRTRTTLEADSSFGIAHTVFSCEVPPVVLSLGEYPRLVWVSYLMCLLEDCDATTTKTIAHLSAIVGQPSRSKENNGAQAQACTHARD